LEVLSWLRGESHLRLTPVVILSSSAEVGDIQQAYALGVNSYLVKPVNFSDLLEMVKSIGMYWMILNRNVAQPPLKSSPSSPRS